MTLIEQIKKDQLDARKNREEIKKNLLTTLIGEASKISKDAHGGDPTDQEVIATVKKFIKNTDELLSHSPGNFTAIQEKTILVGYLPAQLSRLEIMNIIMNEKFNLKDNKIIGIVMSFFKTNYEGRYDAKLVQEILKELKDTAC
jgi:uncharacterized protein YqeY